MPGRAPFLSELHGLRRSLWLERMARASGHGLWMGMVALVVAEATARIARLSPEVLLALASVPLLAVVGCVGLSIARRPTLVQTARSADRRLGLRAQLATALELAQAQPTAFASAQIVRAGTAAAAARRRSPEPVRQWTALVVTCLALSLGAGAAVLVGNDWLASIPLPGYATSAASMADDVGPTEAVQPTGSDSQPLPGSLQQLLQQVSGDEPPSADELASAEQALADKTAESRATQQALSNLASALQQTSAGQAAADALTSGDYADAVADIAQLGQNSDQLSADARRTLSKALANAAQNGANTSSLSDRERRAGDALKYQSYAPTAQALQNLADAVNKASQSVLTQEQLSAAWQQLAAAQQRAQQLGGSAPPGSPQTARPSSDYGPSQPAAGGPAGETDRAAAGRGNSSSGFEPAGTATSLNAAGVRVEVPLQISAGPSRQAQPPTADQAQSLKLVADPALVSDSSVANTQVQPVRAERNSVPADLRPVVRDYFSAGTPSP